MLEQAPRIHDVESVAEATAEAGASSGSAVSVERDTLVAEANTEGQQEGVGAGAWTGTGEVHAAVQGRSGMASAVEADEALVSNEVRQEALDQVVRREALARGVATTAMTSSSKIESGELLTLAGQHQQQPHLKIAGAEILGPNGHAIEGKGSGEIVAQRSSRRALQSTVVVIAAIEGRPR